MFRYDPNAFSPNKYGANQLHSINRRKFRDLAIHFSRFPAADIPSQPPTSQRVRNNVECFRDSPLNLSRKKNQQMQKMVEPRGVEPLTFSLRTRRSTN